MTTPDIVLHILSAVVLMGVICRLFDLKASEPQISSRLTWNLWTLAHVLIAVGMVARLFRISPADAQLVTAGLALMFGIRWSRRSGDRK